LQVPTLQAQQRHQVRWSIALSIIRPFTQLSEQGEQVLLHFASPRVQTAQACQDGGYDEPLLRLPHVFTGSGLRKPMLDEAREPALLDLAGRLLNEQPCHVFQHHRVQCKAARQLSPLDERAAAQTLDC